jgi:hypothetical protein
MNKIKATLLFLIMIFAAAVGLAQPPTTEYGQTLIDPLVLLDNDVPLLQKFARQAGYEPSLETTSDSTQYVYVEADTYSLAIYLDEKNTSWIARIFTQQDKTKSWIDYYDNLVKTQPKLWSKASKDRYVYKETFTEPYYVDIIKEKSGYKRLIMEVHH